MSQNNVLAHFLQTTSQNSLSQRPLPVELCLFLLAAKAGPIPKAAHLICTLNLYNISLITTPGPSSCSQCTLGTWEGRDGPVLGCWAELGQWDCPQTSCNFGKALHPLLPHLQQGHQLKSAGYMLQIINSSGGNQDSPISLRPKQAYKAVSVLSNISPHGPAAASSSACIGEACNCSLSFSTDP